MLKGAEGASDDDGVGADRQFIRCCDRGGDLVAARLDGVRAIIAKNANSCWLDLLVLLLQ